jgi:hypothetical protein
VKRVASLVPDIPLAVSLWCDTCIDHVMEVNVLPDGFVGDWGGAGAG